MPLEDVPERMAWGEAWRLFNILKLDPGSQLAAELAGWKYPIERMDIVLRNLFDLEFSKAKKNPKPHDRPWDKTETRQMGGGRRMSIADYEAVMARQLEEEDGDG